MTRVLNRVWMDYKGERVSVPLIDRLHQRILREIRTDSRKLRMESWESKSPSCGTTHCRGGWAIALCGRAGSRLERRLRKMEWIMSEDAAARLIFAANTEYRMDITGYRECVPMFTPEQSIFYQDAETAMADIVRCAALEPEKYGVLE